MGLTRPANTDTTTTLDTLYTLSQTQFAFLGKQWAADLEPSYVFTWVGMWNYKNSGCYIAHHYSEYSFQYNEGHLGLGLWNVKSVIKVHTVVLNEEQIEIEAVTEWVSNVRIIINKYFELDSFNKSVDPFWPNDSFTNLTYLINDFNLVTKLLKWIMTLISSIQQANLSYSFRRHGI